MVFRSVIRDVIIFYLGYRLIKIWLFKEKFTNVIGLLVLLLMILTIWFILEKLGLLKKGF